jgi:hypothetical protein
MRSIGAFWQRLHQLHDAIPRFLPASRKLEIDIDHDIVCGDFLGVSLGDEVVQQGNGDDRPIERARREARLFRRAIVGELFRFALFPSGARRCFFRRLGCAAAFRRTTFLRHPRAPATRSEREE